MMMLMKLWNKATSVLLLSLATLSLGVAISLASQLQAYHVSWSIAQVGSQVVNFAMIFDSSSLYFLFTVFLISGSIFTFSFSYMKSEPYFLRFHLLVFMFVGSMVLLIVSPNLVSLLLGWDGLGVTSYLLVVYYQTPKATNAGLLTVLSNRVGDVLILVSIAHLSMSGDWELSLGAMGSSSWGASLTLIALASLTKSAQIPFSAWLPAAMAAPTPVSSLVHSSTLVTAGIYLLLRFQPMFNQNALMSFLSTVGSATMLMAGMTALVEMDMKKVIALSTLSQLGVMMTTLGSGLPQLCFFHLLSHAFFKALIFMSIGSLIHLVGDFQDFHKAAAISKFSPASLSFNVLGNASLCGLPFLSGFYSKDLCIEGTGVEQSVAGFSFIFYVATLMTVAYTARLLSTCFYRNVETPLVTPDSESDVETMSSMWAMAPVALSGGSLLSWSLLNTPTEFIMSFWEKLFTLSVIIAGAGIGALGLSQNSHRMLNFNVLVSQSWSLFLISSRLLNQLSLSQGDSLRLTGDSTWVIWSLKSSLQIGESPFTGLSSSTSQPLKLSVIAVSGLIVLGALL